ncbi:hypothetical protein HGA91_04835 [candidate division WWE3 bacterium]|nr:hypothetical protein [candidate division WWE3 bacterium]
MLPRLHWSHWLIIMALLASLGFTAVNPPHVEASTTAASPAAKVCQIVINLYSGGVIGTIIRSDCSSVMITVPLMGPHKAHSGPVYGVTPPTFDLAGNQYPGSLYQDGIYYNWYYRFE